MSRVTVRDFLDISCETLLDEINQLDRDGLFQRYDNPFEQKWFLADKTNLPPGLLYAFESLRSRETMFWLSKLLEVPIYLADFRHYGGLFIYEPGDYLRAHVDAGIHPELNLRKVATSIVYLTDAQLETYTGDTAEKADPLVWGRNLHQYKAGDLVAFTNDNLAWHGVPIVSHTRRVCLTISYLAPQSFEHRHYTNPRTRAYFARTLWDRDTLEIEQLRQLRASEDKHSEVYRMTTEADR
jgi:hypothetical protein